MLGNIDISTIIANIDRQWKVLYFPQVRSNLCTHLKIKSFIRGYNDLDIYDRDHVFVTAVDETSRKEFSWVFYNEEDKWRTDDEESIALTQINPGDYFITTSKEMYWIT